MFNNIPVGDLTREDLEAALIEAQRNNSYYFCENERLRIQMREYSPSLLKQQLQSERIRSSELDQELYKLKRVLINQKRLIRFAQFKFPPTKVDDGETSDVCYFCGLWTEGRYTFINGTWILSPDEAPPSNNCEVVPVCRTCIDNVHGSTRDIISILGREFVIDHMFTAND